MSLSNDIEQASWGVYVVSRFISFPEQAQYFFITSLFSLQRSSSHGPSLHGPDAGHAFHRFPACRDLVILDLYSIKILVMVILHGKQG